MDEIMELAKSLIDRYVRLHSEAYGAPATRQDFIDILHLTEEAVDQAVKALLADGKIRFWSGNHFSGYVPVE